MKTKPILFSAAMVRAILAGTKTQTRRIMQAQSPGPDYEIAKRLHDRDNPANNGKYHWFRSKVDAPDFGQLMFKSPYERGDTLWVQENYRLKLSDERWVNYPASDETWHPWLNPSEDELAKLAARKRHVGLLTPGRFMYRSLSRISLEITGIRVERLQDISEEDALAEGVERLPGTDDDDMCRFKSYLSDKPLRPLTAYESYASLWVAINGPGSWQENPWVWCVSFKPSPELPASPAPAPVSESIPG